MSSVAKLIWTKGGKRFHVGVADSRGYYLPICGQSTGGEWWWPTNDTAPRGRSRSMCTRCPDVAARIARLAEAS